MKIDADDLLSKRVHPLIIALHFSEKLGKITHDFIGMHGKEPEPLPSSALDIANLSHDHANHSGMAFYSYTWGPDVLSTISLEHVLLSYDFLSKWSDQKLLSINDIWVIARDLRSQVITAGVCLSCKSWQIAPIDEPTCLYCHSPLAFDWVKIQRDRSHKQIGELP